MTRDMHQKIGAGHLARLANLYVRQSTPRQVVENTESTKRQYALRERAVALGWPVERVVVIDSDLGLSGADSDRAGFQRLVAAVGMGEVGIVLGLEVSRLARNNTDWHRLLEICALTDTLILDEDGLYNPAHFNDRLLLGLKGTMSEAELHVLRAPAGRPARQGQPRRARDAPAGRSARRPRRPGGSRPRPAGPGRGARVLRDLPTHRLGGGDRAQLPRAGPALPSALEQRPPQRRGRLGTAAAHPLPAHAQEPRYAGAFVYGRSQYRRTAAGRERRRPLPRDQWHTLLLDAHPGYITWAAYEENLRRLHENAQANGGERRMSPPREGPALLQGLVVCGRCGERMTVRYHSSHGRVLPEYVCQKEGIENARSPCQCVLGGDLDRAVGDLLVETVSPLALEVALAVQDELAARAEEADRLRRQQVERARYEAELAQRRYRRVDPDNRLVADSLEADWNRKLRALAEAQDAYERERHADGAALDGRQREQVLALATDFPRLWRDRSTPQRDRKRMLRLLLADVTLLRTDTLVAHIRFRGGATHRLELPLPLNAWQLRQTDPAVIAEIDHLLDQHTEGEIARILNARGRRPGVADRFTARILYILRRTYGLTDRFTRLRRRGLLTLDEIAAQLGVDTTTVKVWRRAGLLRSQPYNDKGSRLYEPPGPDAPVKHKRKFGRDPAAETPTDPTNEVKSVA